MSRQITHLSHKQQLNIRFRVKSAGVSLFVILMIATFYIVNVFSLRSDGEVSREDAISLIIATIVLSIVVEVTLQIVLFVGAGQIEDRTKRDKVAEVRSSSDAYFVLTMGAFVTIAGMFADFTPLEMGNMLVVAFLVAEIVKFASRIVYYWHMEQKSNH